MSRADRLDRILDAGARILGERGFHGTTMRDVAKASATGVATVYHYLAGKEDLLFRVEQRILEAAVASAEAALAQARARERLRAIVTDHLRRILACPFEADVLAGTLPTLRGERGRRIESLRAAYLALVEATVEAVTAPRGRPAAPKRVPGPAAQMLLGGADRLALEARLRGGAPQPGRLAAKALRIFLEGARRRRP